MNSHRIHRVAKLTGLTKDVLRVWEKRYGLVMPGRSANRYRTYSDEDVALLRFMKSEMEKGRSIGTLSAAGRESLLEEMRVHTRHSHEPERPHERLITDLLAALSPFDRASFERRLNGAVAVVPFEEALFRILLPLERRIGELCHSGHLNVAVEHYVSNYVQQKLCAALNHARTHHEGMKVLVACPEGEYHVIGAHAAAYLCAMAGCSVYFLGADMPLGLLVTFAREIHPEVIVLSIVSSLSETTARQFLEPIKELAAEGCRILLGGTGAFSAKKIFESSGIEVLEDLSELEERIKAATAALPSRE